MILDKEITMTWNSNNKKYYIEKGYIFTKMYESFLININDLNPKSNYKIKVKCDVCEKEKYLSFREYNISISNGGYYSCSQKCSHEKSKQTCLNNYGVEHIGQSNIIQTKIKSTNLKNYGVERASQSDKIKNKIKNTYKTFSNDKKINILNKIKNTNLKKYGVENVFNNIDIQNKQKQTNLERYGVENVFKNEIIKEKIKKSNIENYGVEYPLQNTDIFIKNQKSQFKISYYKNIMYQSSYELDFLIYCEKLNILDKIERGKRIKYTYNNKNKIYHPDYYIKDLNLLIEIKSDYHYNLDLNKNILKEEYSLKNNYDFIFIINKDYNIFNEKIKTII